MTTLLETRVMTLACRENLDAIAAAAADESLPWEEVSRIASQGNARMLRLMDTLPGKIEEMADNAMVEAYAVAMQMVQAALPHTDPEYHLELFEGAMATAARVREQVAAGGILPMDYMNMNTRKQIFLVESAFNAPLKKE